MFVEIKSDEECSSISYLLMTMLIPIEASTNLICLFGLFFKQHLK